MQYGQQDYSGYQQGYGAQQGGAQVLWYIDAYAGVMGHNQFSGAVSAINRDRFGSVAQKYSQFPYQLIAGEERILSRWNMQYPVDTVSRSQCTVTVYPDGNALLTSKGSCAPTLLRSQGGQWTPLYDGQTQWLQNGDQIGLDASNPESAVFTCHQAYPQQGGYGY